MRRLFGRLGTIESRFYIIFTFLFFATILTMQVISTRFTITSIRNAALQNNQSLVKELITSIDNYIGGMDSVSRSITIDPNVQAFLSAGSPDSLDRSILEDRFAHYVEVRDDLSAIVLFRMDGDAVNDSGRSPVEFSDYGDSPWYRNALEAGGETVPSTAYVQNLIPGNYSWVVSLSTLVKDEESGEPIGVLLVDLKFNRIKQLCESLVTGEKGYDFIIDAAGDYVFHPTQQLMFSDLKQEPVDEIIPLLDSEDSLLKKEGKNYIIGRSGVTGWYVVSVSHDSDILTGWPYTQIMNAIIGLVLFLIVGLVTNFITQGVTRPLRQLQEVMRSVETGEFRLAGELDATDEIRELAREYDLMVGRIGELMEENIREQELKRKSDLKALQAQINPHFLYNTLDSIIWMGEMDKSEEVVKMTSALSRLFRISISKGRELISLRDELEHVRSYLTIQEMRYKNKFRYLIDMPEDLMDLKVLKITLQPLVENAIYHGIRSVDYEGLIEISGRSEGDSIILTVRDNGKGMDTEKIDALLRERRIGDEDTTRHEGTGVRNVHERIRLYFGADYGLKYRKADDGGTVIDIRIPAGRTAIS